MLLFYFLTIFSSAEHSCAQHGIVGTDFTVCARRIETGKLLISLLTAADFVCNDFLTYGGAEFIDLVKKRIF